MLLCALHQGAGVQQTKASANNQRTGSAGLSTQSQAQQDAFWDKPATVAAGQGDARLQFFANAGQGAVQQGGACFRAEH